MPLVQRTCRAALVSIVAIACDVPSGPDLSVSDNPNFARSTSARVHRVTGGGKLDISLFDPTLPPETYAFSATVDGEGNVRGQLQIRFSDSPLFFHVEITCLSVGGRSAWIGGAVIHTSNAELLEVGRQVWFRVQDNGEGRSDPPDQMSFVRFQPAARCNEQRPVGMPFSFVSGNLSVN